MNLMESLKLLKPVGFKRAFNIKTNVSKTKVSRVGVK